MFDLELEFDSVRAALSAAEIEYALCGGLAVGVLGFARSTIDIDLLIKPGDEARVYDVVAPLGFTVKAMPMNFDLGATQIRRVSKIDATDGEVLMLDLLLVTPALENVWDTRERLLWRDRELWVVSAEGLIAMKRRRSSPMDLADIEKLENLLRKPPEE
jgi:hypothetical protein